MAVVSMAVDTNLTAEVLFDEVAGSYQQVYGNNDGLNRALDRLRDYQGTGASVLDVGCGPGGPAAYMAKSGFKVTGIDVSQVAIDICQRNVPGNFYKADMTDFEPNQQFDAIISLYSMFQMSHWSTCSVLFKFASWLRPGGTLVLATIPAEDLLEDKSQLDTSDYVERYQAPFMGRSIAATLITMKGWLGILQRAGLTIQHVERHGLEIEGFGTNEHHLFITAQRTSLEPLYGPHPVPAFRRPPHLLSQDAWQPFAERLTRHELDAVLEAVGQNKEVLDIGSGHGGELSKCWAYAIEPNGERNKLLVDNSHQSSVEIRHGTAEKLPFGDKRFDAAVALWILHYVHDLEQSLSEMARVVDPAAPNARIVIVQGAPDNDVVGLINKACAPIAGQGMTDHQGVLLATAARVFTNRGFGNISLVRVDARCNFPEEDMSTRCQRAAAVLTGFWYLDHPRSGEMREAFLPILREHFADRPFEVGDQAVMLVAQPTMTTERHMA
ncbi:hypothetical protein G6O67_006713 [Ophiocordyceps sinensis]|uniref:Methyltransferase type 11 domain-containing protein n=1 Tax=Ophiocordyceps sinensis TaxID=72228 RepID=A0A8H4PN72_9HYPO|nr:hypothetical protein G6O67_006713 [Ophiocordyceps sinensis]